MKSQSTERVFRRDFAEGRELFRVFQGGSDHQLGLQSFIGNYS